MGVRLVIGRAATGKTRRIFDAIADELRRDPLGPQIYWIVPKQATFITERLLTCDSGLAGFCRASVLSFETLGQQILAECGGAAVPEITAVGRQMILGHVLRQHAGELRFLGAAAKQTGVAQRLDTTFAEFERCGRTSEDLGTLLDDLQRAMGPNRSAAGRSELQGLYDKVHDLKLIYDAYCQYLGQERLDRHRRLQHVLSCVEHSRRLRGARVYVDGFRQFTDYERHVLAALGKACAVVEIALLMDPSSPLVANPHANPAEMSLFHEVELTARRLHATFAECSIAPEPPILLHEPTRTEPRALFLVERDFCARHAIAHPEEPAACIEMIQAPDRRAEVDAVARRIRQLWRQGVRLRQIGVLVRDVDAYHELIQASFWEHSIPYFADRRRPIAHHSIVQFLRSALAIAQSAWPHDSVMALLKTGLSGLADADCDELENYVLEHRVRGAAAWTSDSPWTYTRKLVGPEDEVIFEVVEASHVDGLRRRLVERLRPFIRAVSAPGQTIRSIVLHVFDLLKQFDVTDVVAQWMQQANDAQEFEQREEHARAWAQLVELLDQMVELLGDEPATLEDFVRILESGLEQFELAIAPPTLDQVLVGQVDRTRTPDLRVVFVMGLNEGCFPHAAAEDTVLSDGERRQLRDHNLEVDPDTQRRLLDENLLAYVALTSASERVILTRSMSDPAGKPLGPSRYWLRMLELFPALAARICTIAPEASPWEAVGTPRQLVTTLMGVVRGMEDRRHEGTEARRHEGQEKAKDESAGGAGLPLGGASGAKGGPCPPYLADFAALYNWLASHPTVDDAIDVMRLRAWGALVYANEAELSGAVAAPLLAEALDMSVTRIEMFAACPFKHFATYGLGLKPREEGDEVSAIDLGNVLHCLLERLVRGMVEKRQDWLDLEEPEREQIIGRLTQEAAQEVRAEILLSGGRNRHILGRIERTAQQVTLSQQAASRRGDFVPAYAELTFGGRDGVLPSLEIRTPDGRTIRLHGKIDRVDVAADDAALAVIDYKLRGSRLMLDYVYYGLSLQLLTYLLVLRENGEKLGLSKLSPAAALYVKLLRGLNDVAHPSEGEVDDPDELHLKAKPRGIINARHLKNLDKTLGKGWSEVVSVMRKSGEDEFGHRNSTDIATAEELAALINYVEAAIGRLADRMLGGQITARPFLMNRVSACARCDLQSVCRFDPGINRYSVLTPLGREEVLDRVSKASQASQEVADGQ